MGGYEPPSLGQVQGKEGIVGQPLAHGPPQHFGIPVVGTYDAGHEQLAYALGLLLVRLRGRILAVAEGLPQAAQKNLTEAHQTLALLSLAQFLLSAVHHLLRINFKPGKFAPRPERGNRPCLVVSSRSETVEFGFDRPCRIIGERINPTGKADLTAELQRIVLF